MTATHHVDQDAPCSRCGGITPSITREGATYCECMPEDMATTTDCGYCTHEPMDPYCTHNRPADVRRGPSCACGARAQRILMEGHGSDHVGVACQPCAEAWVKTPVGPYAKRRRLGARI